MSDDRNPTIEQLSRALNHCQDVNADLLAALETIAGGHTARFPGAPDVMTMAPDDFRHAMWSWSQEVARAAVSKAKE